MAIFQDNRDPIERLYWLGWAFFVMVLLLFSRLWYLSVASFDHYDHVARRNHIRTVPILAARGPIEDRNGHILVENTYGFDLVLFREKKPGLDRTLQFLSEALQVSREELEERLREASHYSLYQPVVVSQGLTLDQISFLMARRSDHPLLDIVERPSRFYPHGKLAAHVLGYVGEISSDELRRPAFKAHGPGDFIGKSGIERIYNRELVGQNGVRRIRVDSQGRAFEELEPMATTAGEKLRLTIDLDIQKAAEDALEGHTGAIVALDPGSGEILALASRPTFDPNEFATRISSSRWKELATHPGHPFQNRSIQNGFPPGSVFKIVMALAGLESQLINSQQHVLCTGSQRLFGHDFRCSASGGHGWIDLEAALQYSCNIYFYQLGRNLGIDRIQVFARQFGLGRKTGIDLPGEISGLVPSREWKREMKGTPWYPGETISVSIGQGPILVTPLQMAVAVGAVATGRLVQPHLCRPAPGESRGEPQRLFAPEQLEKIRAGLWRAVNQNGTAERARVEGFEVVGKTSTVQTIGRASRERLGPARASRFRSTAWFVGYAPANNPRVVVAVILEGAGSGGAGAAPVAREILQAFHSRNAPSDMDLPVMALNTPR